MRSSESNCCGTSRRLVRNTATCVLASLLAIAASGCRIPQLCCPKPGPVMPDEFVGTAGGSVPPGADRPEPGTPANAAYLGIEEFFGDPELFALIVDGLDNNQELRIRNQEIRIAANEIMARRSVLFPIVGVGLLSGFDKSSRYTPLGAAEEQLPYPGGGAFPDPLTNTRMTADLTWHIDVWREFRNARDAARQRYVEAIESRNYLITQIVAETAENYFRLPALDRRLELLDQTIAIQQRSLEAAIALRDAGQGTELPVQRFLAEVRKNESERAIVAQQIVEVENRVNFLVGRYPQRVARTSWESIEVDARIFGAGFPADLLLQRRDIRAAERELAAAGLDVSVARAHFYPRVDLTAGIGYEAFDSRFLFDPGSFIAGAAGQLVAPLINRKAIEAEYLNANARQLQAVYEYQRTILQAYTEVVNSLRQVENYRTSLAIKQEQVRALESSVEVATNLFQNVEGEYLDVLFSQRDLLEARIVQLETRQELISAVVQTYRALGGGLLLNESGMQLPELFRSDVLIRTREETVLPAPVAPPVEALPAEEPDPTEIEIGFAPDASSRRGQTSAVR
ncbi:MAG TPA: hypothetical protein DCQ98_19755 [Planctomycetaceae bacterium]|nr:hypothetical protein [Planctomycetaceae bacterium]HRF00251.1 TolC family protein [Pirellulaceae bacterium]